ncbi:MAG: CBS domain-containing protein [Dehalococcoidia bacterium]|nr:CBS domain-containing protein [Dehalococcoidia bacterium]
MLNDKIVTLNLPQPVRVPSGTSVRHVIETVQRHRTGAVVVCQDDRLVGIMTERDVLMKVVARDVDYDEPVDRFMTPNPRTLTPDRTIGEAITLMNDAGFRNVPIVDGQTGEAVALFRVRDVIEFLAESFPEQVINLPPRSDQKMETPEGA